MKKKLIIVIVCLLIVLTIYLYFKKSPNNIEVSTSLYSWNVNKVLEDTTKFYGILEKYDITTLYQDFSKEELQSKDDSLIKVMNSIDISVYHLGGDPSWGQENGYEKIEKEIFRVLDFNNNVKYPIKGVVLDIEPYASEREENFSEINFGIYVEQIKKSYQLCQNNNLELILAIPYWFDTIDEALLIELIKNSDKISVMNYDIEKTSSKIKREVELAKKYNKKIETIYEIEYGKEGYFASHQAILDDYEKLKEEYPNLGISYHHYGSIK